MDDTAVMTALQGLRMEMRENAAAARDGRARIHERIEALVTRMDTMNGTVAEHEKELTDVRPLIQQALPLVTALSFLSSRRRAVALIGSVSLGNVLITVVTRIAGG